MIRPNELFGNIFAFDFERLSKPGFSALHPLTYPLQTRFKMHLWISVVFSYAILENFRVWTKNELSRNPEDDLNSTSHKRKKLYLGQNPRWLFVIVTKNRQKLFVFLSIQMLTLLQHFHVIFSCKLQSSYIFRIREFSWVTCRERLENILKFLKLKKYKGYCCNSKVLNLITLSLVFYIFCLIFSYIEIFMVFNFSLKFICLLTR